jgi:hypothetical protein
MVLPVCQNHRGAATWRSAKHPRGDLLADHVVGMGHFEDCDASIHGAFAAGVLILRPSLNSDELPAMSADHSQPDPAPTIRRPDRKLILLRLAAQAVRVTASTIAVVALLRQQWVAAGAFAIVWLLILGAPRVFSLLQDSEEQ